MVADDVVSFGTVNHDAWALYRNSELMMLARSEELAALVRERLFEPDIFFFFFFFFCVCARRRRRLCDELTHPI